MMTREDLLAKLQIYKKEIYRRAYLLLFAAFLPLVIVFFGVGITYNIVALGIPAIVLYFGTFTILMGGIIWWFASMVKTGIPKKIDLLCPKCDEPIIKNNVEEFLATGVCCQCGTKILKD